jgi:hypothetical protein
LPIAPGSLAFLDHRQIRISAIDDSQWIVRQVDRVGVVHAVEDIGEYIHRDLSL